MASQVKLKRDSVDLPSSRRVQRQPVVQQTQSSEPEDLNTDQWHREEPGEEHRYARHRRTQTAAQAYRQSAALKDQRSVHKPFYMEDLGREPAASQPQERPAPPPMPRVTSYQRPTRFYPHTGDDAISPVGRVKPAQLQRILPSYELSTEETRESGLGPALERGVYPRRSAKRES